MFVEQVAPDHDIGFAVSDRRLRCYFHRDRYGNQRSTDSQRDIYTQYSLAGGLLCPIEGHLHVKYDFLVQTYETERIKVLSVWSEFKDEDLPIRPRHGDARGRSVHEQMVHQCVSEDLWFRNMLSIDVGAPPLPMQETRLEFMRRYAEDSEKRLQALRDKNEPWWEEDTKFFDTRRSRAWVMTRRIAHTSHHRGQLMAMLRMLGRSVHSNYGPTADTGGLMQNHAPTIYAYPNIEALLSGEAAGAAKAPLPGGSGKPVTERPAPERGKSD
jgi:uncharacterized damage-inducible protein DinB